VVHQSDMIVEQTKYELGDAEAPQV
jgi:hypothetical protein